MSTAKRKPGRPPRAGKPAEERIEIRVTKAELAELQRSARAAGVSLGALVRSRCFATP